MKKLFYATLITLLGILCLTVKYDREHYSLLKVQTADEFFIDFNHNLSIDSNEVYKVPNFKICTNPTDKLSADEVFIINGLAKNFAKEFFFNKKVRFDKDNNIFADNKNYLEELNNNGFNYNINPQKYNELLAYIRSNEFFIVNPHNNKFHKIDCKHAINSEHYELFEAKDLPSKSKPCKVCNSNLAPKSSNKPITILKSFQHNNIELNLTDHTTQLKPSLTCSSDICKELVSKINSAQKSIDMAIYGYTYVPEIEQAIKNAMKRGVKIRMVYDLDAKGFTTYNDSTRLAKLVNQSNNDFETETPDGKYSNIIMHNKFYIIDNKTVITGSANLSPNDMSGFNSNTTITIHLEDIAKLYTEEFEQMLKGNFHHKKLKSSSNRIFRTENCNIEVYFSPQDRITKNHIIPLIKSARNYIYIPAFLITDKWLADELIFAKQKGIDIKIILDASQAFSPYSQIKRLREAGILVKVENYAGKLHSKSILIDDRVSVIGSMNFSKSGQNKNDENVIIIKNNNLTQNYRQYFEYLWNRIDNKWLTRIPRAESIDSIGSCTDGIDNNFDKLTDSADAGCKSINKY